MFLHQRTQLLMTLQELHFDFLQNLRSPALKYDRFHGKVMSINIKSCDIMMSTQGKVHF